MNRIDIKKLILPLLGLSLMLLLTACPQSSGGNGGERPSITAFSADPVVLPFGGGSTTLSWTVTGAETLELEPGIGEVTGNSREVQLTSTQTFTLKATNENGSVEESVEVTVEAEVVEDPPVINSFTVDPAELPAGGGEVTFTWDVTDATVIEIDNGIGIVESAAIGPAGMITVMVESTADYTLTASNSAGSSTQKVAVTVAPAVDAPEINSFTASQNNLPVGGGNVTLNWQVTNADSLSIDQGVGDVTGATSKEVNVSNTTTFTLTATNSVASTTATVTISVAQAGNRKLGTVNVVETKSTVAGQTQLFSIGGGSFNEFLGNNIDLPAEPWQPFYDQCFLSTDDPEDNSPVQEDDIGTSLDAGETLDLKFNGATVTNLQKQVDSDGNITYLPPLGTFINQALPDNVTIDIPGADFPSFTGAAFPNVNTVTNFSPTSGADLNSNFSWDADQVSNAILIGLLGDLNSTDARGVFCITRDDGSFNVPADTIAEVGNFPVEIIQVARFAVRQETKGDAVLYLTTTKSETFGFNITIP